MPGTRDAIGLRSTSEEGRMHAAFGRLLAGRPTECEDEGFPDWLTRHLLAPYASARVRRSEPRLYEALRSARAQATAAHLLRVGWVRPLLEELTSSGAAPIAFKGLGV